MPLNRPALSLGSGPRGVQDARRWVSATFADINRDDLAECAELGVSELVTNALLHATPPIQVAVRGTREHPRVEVRDRSADKPVLPEPIDHDDLEAELLTFGRGLNIVARASDAWGAEIEDDGKVVWFTPAAQFSDTGREGVITGATVDDPGALAGAGDTVALDIRNVPVAAYTAFQRHYRELRREVRLLALAHEQEYPLAKSLSDLFGSLEKPLRHDLGADQVAGRRGRRRDPHRSRRRDASTRRRPGRAADRAARPRRCVLPRGAPAVAGAQPRAGHVPAVVPG